MNQKQMRKLMQKKFNKEYNIDNTYYIIYITVYYITLHNYNISCKIINIQIII